MDNKIFETFLDYGVLGAVCIFMGIILYKYWQQDRKEKQRLIERLEECNDKIKDLADNEKD
jgi:hypothetical protein